MLQSDCKQTCTLYSVYAIYYVNPPIRLQTYTCTLYSIMYCDDSCVSSPSLGVEPVDKDVMSRPPRKATDRMVTLPLLFQIVTTSLTIVAGTLWVFRKEVQLYLLINASLSTSVPCTIYMYMYIQSSPYINFVHVV